MSCDRLERLPTHDLGDGLRLHEASSHRARLVGLALLDRLPAGHALLLPRCSSVHTFGMRFALDVMFLDGDGGVLRTYERVGPGRVVCCPGARAALETRAGDARRFLEAEALPGRADQPPEPEGQR